MKSTSRKPRSESYRYRDLTDIERDVCEAFATRLQKANAALESAGERRISFPDFHRLTGRHSLLWGMYARGQRPMPVEAMLDVAMIFRERPQDIFPQKGWRWALLTQIAPDERLGIAEQLLSELREHERMKLMRIMDAYAQGSRARRRQIDRAVERLTATESGPATTSKSA